ncbi:MAG: ribonuclease Y [Acidobacteriota bacterium]
MVQVVIWLIAVAVGAGAGWLLNLRAVRRRIEEARQKAERIIGEAGREAQRHRRSAQLQAREELMRSRRKAENDLRNRQRALAQQQRSQEDRERSIRDRIASTKKRDEAVRAREQKVQEIERRLNEQHERVRRMIEEENAKLERVSGLSEEEARRQLLANLRSEARFEASHMIKEIKDEAQRVGEHEGRKILALAIERCASEFTAEKAVTSVPISGDKIKGRLIGHEGKNIRSFEAATGIQLIVDENPDAVVLSGFNPIKREVARLTLERLIREGNITPRRIEELANRMRQRVEDSIARAGKETVRSLNIQNLHPELVQLLGRLKYRWSYGQNVLEHSKEVARLTSIMASELRLDSAMAKRAGLLHDIGKAIDYEREGTHPEIGAEVATRCREPEEVINAIASHHEDVEVTSPISVLVSAADAVSGSRPGARRRTMVDYVRRVEKLESIAGSMDGVEQSYAIQAGREIRVIAKSKIVDDAHVELLASELAQRIQREMEYPGRIKVTVIRELRATEYAR